jgi:hypothetical protein
MISHAQRSTVALLFLKVDNIQHGSHEAQGLFEGQSQDCGLGASNALSDMISWYCHRVDGIILFFDSLPVCFGTSGSTLRETACLKPVELDFSYSLLSDMQINPISACWCPKVGVACSLALYLWLCSKSRTLQIC